MSFQENNDGYQPDGISKRRFDQTLNEVLDQIEPNKNHPRNNVNLDVNFMIASGQYGDIYRGKLDSKPCRVHVVSGTHLYTCCNIYNFYTPNMYGVFIWHGC